MDCCTTNNTLCSQFMRFRIMRFSIYAVLENGPNSCFMLQYSHIMRFLVKIIVYKILLIFFLHICDSCIMQFLLGNKKCINGELSVLPNLNFHAFPVLWKIYVDTQVSILFCRFEIMTKKIRHSLSRGKIFGSNVPTDHSK